MNIEVKKSVKSIDYAESMKILERRVDDVFLGKKDELLWVLEHNHVYTAGTSAKDGDLLDKSINVIKTNRGGKHTYHGPGQKVVYFVINLNKRGKDIRKFVTKIENCIIDVLAEYKIQSFPDKKNIGIWVSNNNKVMKIAAIGIRVKKWIAYHGFSININNDLENYKKIIPCGISDKGVTNLKNIINQDYSKLSDQLIENFVSNLKI